LKIIKLMSNMTLPENFVWDYPDGEDHYLFVLFKSPSMLVTDNGAFSVDIGDAVVLDRFAHQKYYSTSGKFVHDFIHFDFDNAAEKLEFSDIPFSTVIRIDHYALITNILDLISNCPVPDSPLSQSIASHLGRAFLLALKACIRTPQVEHLPELIHLRNDVKSNPQFPWTVDNMAKRVALSRSQLQLLYRKAFNTSCIDDVIASRIELAKRLLLIPEITVAKAAELCGYENKEHFIRQFRQKEATTPGRYKKERSKQS